VKTQGLIGKQIIGAAKLGKLNIINKMIKLIHLIKEEAIKCPVATQNIEVNLKHRQIAIDRYGYGPLNPNNPNIKFWKEKAERWKLDSIEEAKSARCNSCAAFNITSKILNCIEKGLSSGEKEVSVNESDDSENAKINNEKPQNDDLAWDTIDAGKLGYCTMHKFKCAGSRTCDAWITGGPVKDN